MNLYLNGIEDFSIACADTLTQPAFLDGSQLRKFDIVLANPPYSIKQWNREAFANDKWGRNFLGTPPQGRADYAFLQHILASMNDNSGRCAILFPHGVLFRKEEFEMRQKLVELDLVECVIGIGKNLFYNSPMEACIVICKNNKSGKRKGNILFIDAKEEVTRKNAQSYLEDVHISKITQAYNDFCDVDGFAKVVRNEEIVANNKSKLSIKRYVRPIAATMQLSLSECVSEWNTISTEINSTIDGLISQIE
jgi:type I restriction enzyme M protein